MADGCYDEDGRCVNCNQFHPCNCESEHYKADVEADYMISKMEKDVNEYLNSIDDDNGYEQAEEMQSNMERQLDRYLTWFNEERD